MAKVSEMRDTGEVSVETGLGFIVKLEEPKGRNARVEINADHLQDPVSGWVDTTATALYDRVREAARDGRRVEYRVVVKRKTGQPADLPIAEVGKRDKVRDLEWLDIAGGIVPSGGDATPAQTPVNGSGGTSARPDPSPAASGPQGGGSEASDDLPDVLRCGLCSGDLRGAGRVITDRSGVRRHEVCPGAVTDNDAPPGRLPSDPPSTEPVNGNGNGAGPRMAEGRPWEFSNSDGTLNPGSYAYGAAEGMVLLANDLLLARARSVEGEFKPPTEGQLRGLARRLIRAADRAQAALRADGHVSRMAASHTRCRSAIRVALDVHPVPWGAHPAELDVWETALVDYAGVVLRLTVELVEGDAS